MKTAFALYDGFSLLDFATLIEPLARAGVDWQACAPVSEVFDARGLHFYPTHVTATLEGYERVIVPGGAGAAAQAESEAFRGWLATAAGARIIAAANEGAVLASAAGLGAVRSAPAPGALVIELPLVTASGAEGVRALAEWLARGELPRSEERALPAAIPVTGQGEGAPERRAVVRRETGETRVEVRLDVDGAGRHEIDTGLPFLDHMLAQIAVHGLFDLYVKAEGDLHIDPHHTTEDTALTLGTAFQQALGDRKGITRTASADCPMDESLAWAAVDFSGRPYCVLQAEWHGPAVGGLPVSLIAHFFESFAINARCTLHAAVRYGRDDHHQVEALFKAFARALCAAARIDPRRAGQTPSSKGILF